MEITKSFLSELNHLKECADKKMESFDDNKFKEIEEKFQDSIKKGLTLKEIEPLLVGQPEEIVEAIKERYFGEIEVKSETNQKIEEVKEVKNDLKIEEVKEVKNDQKIEEVKEVKNDQKIEEVKEVKNDLKIEEVKEVKNDIKIGEVKEIKNDIKDEIKIEELHEKKDPSSEIILEKKIEKKEEVIDLNKSKLKIIDIDPNKKMSLTVSKETSMTDPDVYDEVAVVKYERKFVKEILLIVIVFLILMTYFELIILGWLFWIFCSLCTLAIVVVRKEYSPTIKLISTILGPLFIALYVSGSDTIYSM